MVHVVLDKRHLLSQTKVLDRLLQNGIPSPIGGDYIGQGMTFRRGIFQMPHVEIDTTRIRQEPAVAGRFVMSPMMQVKHALPLDMKQIIADLVREPGG